MEMERVVQKHRSLFMDQRTKQIRILLVISCSTAHHLVVGGAHCRYLWIRWHWRFVQREGGKKRRAFITGIASGITCRPCGSESQYAEPFVGVHRRQRYRFNRKGKAVHKGKQRSIYNRPRLIGSPSITSTK